MVGWIISGPEILLRERSSIRGQYVIHGPCIDNLGSVVILRGGKNLDCTNAKKQQ